RQPGDFTHFPLGICQRLGFTYCRRDQPKPWLLVVFIHDARIILILFLFFFGVTLGIGGEKRDLLAVGRPRKTTYAPFSFGQCRTFSAVRAHDVNLLLLVAIGKKGELLPIGRPARRGFI